MNVRSNGLAFVADSWNIRFDCDEIEEFQDQSSAYPIDKDTGGRSRRGFFSSLGRSFKELGLTIAADAPMFIQPKRQTIAHTGTKAHPGPRKAGSVLPCAYDRPAQPAPRSEQELDNAMLDREVQTRFLGEGVYR